jgi:hypothetical protein
MRERLSRSEAMSDWVWPLLLGLLALAVLAAWLGWQMMALRREQQLGWQNTKAQLMLSEAQAALDGMTDEQGTAAAGATAMAAAAASSEGDAFADALAGRMQTSPQSFDRSTSRFAATEGLTDDRASPARPAPMTPGRATATPAWPPPAPAEDFWGSLPANDVADEDAYALASKPSSAAKPASTANAESSARDLSIEELIDLEQQAEFFIVLGQDESAIDLLVEHTRITGGSSPLPYLKLLEIYQRRGEREAFERTRQRFNQRFNAYAAEWGTSLDAGSGLESYPGVLPRLEHIWPRPLDAMAELEALLFRKSHGELFDLPAYREVLFLYALARDLLDHADINTSTVDLLLPLSDGGEFGVTAPHPYFGMDRDSVFDRYAAYDGADIAADIAADKVAYDAADHVAADIDPTAPVDLDLSQDEAPARIIDPLPPRKPK